jgi:hypothetical protein
MQYELSEMELEKKKRRTSLQWVSCNC